MSKSDDLLSKELSYHQFCDYISSAWLVAEDVTGIYPGIKFRLALFADLEKRVAQTSKGWKWIDHGQFVEIIPIKDLKDHNLGDECWCSPRRMDEEHERPIISHNAKDGRA